MQFSGDSSPYLWTHALHPPHQSLAEIRTFSEGWLKEPWSSKLDPPTHALLKNRQWLAMHQDGDVTSDLSGVISVALSSSPFLNTTCLVGSQDLITLSQSNPFHCHV